MSVNFCTSPRNKYMRWTIKDDWCYGFDSESLREWIKYIYIFFQWKDEKDKVVREKKMSLKKNNLWCRFKWYLFACFRFFCFFPSRFTELLISFHIFPFLILNLNLRIKMLNAKNRYENIFCDFTILFIYLAKMRAF